MNDLAEKALHGLDIARRAVITHPVLSFAATGFAVSSVIVVAGGRVNTDRAIRPLNSWLGLQGSRTGQYPAWAAGAVMLAALAALVLLWLGVVTFVRRREQSEGRLWWLAAAWGLPFVLGPPLMGTTVQSYAAFGLLQRQGLNPYHVGPSGLGSDPIVTAIAPGWRGVPSAAGPLGALVQHLAVSISAGSAFGAIIILRAVAVIAAVLIGRLAADLGGPRRSRALTLTILNPLLLLYVVSGARLDGLMLALVLAALAAASQRRWLVAVALTCVAGSVLAEAFVVLPAVVVAHWLARRGTPTWLLLGRDLLVAAVTTLAAGLLVPHGFGWLRTITKQFSAHTPFSVVGAIGKVLTPVVRGASYDDLAAGARITAVTAMVCVVGYLVITSRQRALERTAGYSLLALALLAPVLYPWYLLWGTICLAPSANGKRRTAVLALCAAGCLMTPPGFGTITSDVITAVVLCVIAAAAYGVPTLRHPAAPALTISAETPPIAHRARARS